MGFPVIVPLGVEPRTLLLGECPCRGSEPSDQDPRLR